MYGVVPGFRPATGPTRAVCCGLWIEIACLWIIAGFPDFHSPYHYHYSFILLICKSSPNG